MDSKNKELLIKPAKNGFMLYVNYDFSSSAVKPTPYVFETMGHLLNFIQDNITPAYLDLKE